MQLVVGKEWRGFKMANSVLVILVTTTDKSRDPRENQKETRPEEGPRTQKGRKHTDG